MISASIELATGVALIAVPNFVANLLLGTGLEPSGEAVARVGGLGLISLTLACWPSGEEAAPQAIRALFFYNLMAAGYLGSLRMSGEFVGMLLLPAALLHAVLGLLFGRAAYRSFTVRGDTSEAGR